MGAGLFGILVRTLFWSFQCVRVCVPSLVKVNEKNHIVSEAGQSVGRRHGDDEGKDVIYESVECLQTNNKK